MNKSLHVYTLTVYQSSLFELKSIVYLYFNASPKQQKVASSVCLRQVSFKVAKQKVNILVGANFEIILSHVFYMIMKSVQRTECRESDIC